MKRVTDIQQRSVSLRRTDGCGKRSDAVAEVTERRAAQQGGEWFSRFTLNYTSTDRFESDKERVKHEDDGNKNKWVSSTQSKRESSSHSKTGASRTITNRLLRRTLKGRPWVSCRCPMSAEKKASNDDDTVEKSGNPNKLFVGNLPFTFKAQDLADLFRPYGNIQGAKIVQDRETSKSKGFGFITFENDENVTKAVQKMNGKVINDRAITVKMATARGTGSIKNTEGSEAEIKKDATEWLSQPGEKKNGGKGVPGWGKW